MYALCRWNYRCACVYSCWDWAWAHSLVIYLSAKLRLLLRGCHLGCWLHTSVHVMCVSDGIYRRVRQWDTYRIHAATLQHNAFWYCCRLDRLQTKSIESVMNRGWNICMSYNTCSPLVWPNRTYSSEILITQLLFHWQTKLNKFVFNEFFIFNTNAWYILCIAIEIVWNWSAMHWTCCECCYLCCLLVERWLNPSRNKRLKT